MENSTRELARPLDFLKIWHNVFSKKIEYAVEFPDPGLVIDPDKAGDGIACEMGQWIAAQSREVLSLPNYQQLVSVHEAFHVAAAQLLTLHQAGNASGTQFQLAKFTQMSQAVCLAIEALSDDLVRLKIYPERFPLDQDKKNSIWNDSFAIGHPEIDRQHRAIATLIDQVLVNSDIDCASTEAGRFLGFLAKLIERDIETENAQFDCLSLQRKAELAVHMEEHRSILNYLSDLRRSISAHEKISFAEVGRYLANWYIDHLVMHDLDLEVKSAS